MLPKFESLDRQSAILWRKFGELFWTLDDSEQRSLLESARQHLVLHLDDFETGFRLGNGDGWRCFVVEDAVNAYKPNAVMLAMRETVRECGWWRPATRVCFMVDRPTTLELDTNLELHHFDGKAVEYSDGFGLYAVHGIVVTEDIAFGRFTCDDIEDAKNSEIRRVMIDRFGAENYLQATGAAELHRDQCGVLYIKDVPRDEPIVMVKVINSTAEPDGSFKEYFLRVPPNTRTAREGIAWTFGMSEYEYKPGVET